ncbi:MAG: alpha/beta hydrolase, partial [Candidatus Rokubacteria bacterium]|nr:alpha/beta hydrolase [Candidatus Rokubacteria bacterium]
WRTEHFPRLRSPALFIHGTRDPFGSLEELERARSLIAAHTELVAVRGGHDLGYSCSAPAERDLPERVRDALATLVRRAAARPA